MLHLVMHKLVCTFVLRYILPGHRRPERFLDLLLCTAGDQREGRYVEAIAEAGGKLQHVSLSRR